MIISKTPYRMSFFGGGTDYPAWYLEHGGSVLATSIDKYCYISCRKLPPFFEHKHRIVYSAIENVKEIGEIKHPAVRGVFEWANVRDGLEIHHDGDLPARSGLGSSSSFTVGLINVLYALQGRYLSKMELGLNAIHVEQNVIGENVGSQDQMSAAYGGFNRIDFAPSGDITVSPIVMNEDRRYEFSQHLMLFFTGVTRQASEVAKHQIDKIPDRHAQLKAMHKMVDQAVEILGDDSVDLSEFGFLLNKSWEYKRSLSEHISTPYIDELYERAIAAGALGGKILGAGGGGFIVFFVPPSKHQDLRDALDELVHVPFGFDVGGATIALYQPDGL